MKKMTALICGVALVCLTILWYQPFTTASAASPASSLTTTTDDCPAVRFNAPLLTHGFARAYGLENGDQFLLNSLLKFTLTSSRDGVSTLSANNDNFGGTAGLTGTSPEGISASVPGSVTTALSCLESLWDINFHIATSGATDGDVITIFTQSADGSKVIKLAVFRIQGGQAILTTNDGGASVHHDDRFARGSKALTLTYIDRAPIAIPAGSAGLRTNLLTIALSMLPDAPTMGCNHLGVEIKRSSGAGKTSVVLTDVVVNRNEQPGDRDRTETGLLAGLIGGYPTGVKCPAVCTPCPPEPGKCEVVCFQSSSYYRLQLGGYRVYGPYCGVNVVIGGHNFNTAVNVCQAQTTVQLALKGGSVFNLATNANQTPMQALNQQFIPAQISLQLWTGGYRFDALWSNLSCYGQLNTLPTTLSNGFTLSGNSMLKDLYMQTLSAIDDATANPMNMGRQDDLRKLAAIWLELNGISAFAHC